MRTFFPSLGDLDRKRRVEAGTEPPLDDETVLKWVRALIDDCKRSRPGHERVDAEDALCDFYREHIEPRADDSSSLGWAADMVMRTIFVAPAAPKGGPAEHRAVVLELVAAHWPRPQRGDGP